MAAVFYLRCDGHWGTTTYSMKSASEVTMLNAPQGNDLGKEHTRWRLVPVPERPNGVFYLEVEGGADEVRRMSINPTNGWVSTSTARGEAEEIRIEAANGEGSIGLQSGAKVALFAHAADRVVAHPGWRFTARPAKDTPRTSYAVFELVTPADLVPQPSTPVAAVDSDNSGKQGIVLGAIVAVVAAGVFGALWLRRRRARQQQRGSSRPVPAS